MGSLNEVQFMKNGKMDKNVDFLASDIPLVEKNWWPPDFNNLTILHLPLI